MQLIDLANYIKNSKKFILGLAADIDEVLWDITDYVYISDDMTFYLIAGTGESIAVKDVLRESYKYPVATKLAVICEELNCLASAKSFSTHYGNQSFGEPNLAIIHI